MKKLLYVLMVVVLSFALFACNPSGNNNNDGTDTPNTPVDPTGTVATWDELKNEDGTMPALKSIAMNSQGLVQNDAVAGSALKWSVSELEENTKINFCKYNNPSIIATFDNDKSIVVKFLKSDSSVGNGLSTYRNNGSNSTTVSSFVVGSDAAWTTGLGLCYANESSISSAQELKCTVVYEYGGVRKTCTFIFNIVASC